MSRLNQQHLYEVIALQYQTSGSKKRFSSNHLLRVTFGTGLEKKQQHQIICSCRAPLLALTIRSLPVNYS